MERTWKPATPGILCIIAGVIALIFGLMFALLGGIIGGLFGAGWLSAIGAPLIVPGIFAIVGGIYALRRRIWGLALAGSIVATIVGLAVTAISGSGIFWVAGILGILAIIFVAMGTSEFA